MSQDPQSGYNPDPEKPYTDPSAYEIPSPPPAGVPPSPNPYQEPPQTYYGEYQQPHYGMPPQGPYGTPGYGPNQGGYGYNPGPGGYGYNPNQGSYGYEASSPLPLSQAINQLPNQYIKVLTKPSPFTFAAEMGKASWDILWVQLIGYALIASVLAYLHMQIYGLGTYNTSDSTSAQIFSVSRTIAQVLTYGDIIIIPASFFIGQGIIYLLAKAFGGNGTFLKQGYTYLLIMVPIGIVTSALSFIPILGSFVAFSLSIYVVVLQVFSLMAVHRLSGGKATAVVLIPIGIAFLLGIILGIILVVATLATLPSTPSPYSP